MKISVRAGGHIKSGPERDLIDDYLKRSKALARPLGFTDISEHAIDLRKAKSRSEETDILLANIAPTDVVIILDERGKEFTSRQMAKKIANWRDDGQKQVFFIIGGADGFEPAALPPGTVKWRLGAQTWPHKLVRVMITEQIYRALSILAKTPYHRD